MRKFSLFLMALAFQGVSAHAVETSITILGVRFPDANSNQAGVLLSQVAQHWPTATGTTITLANGGVPLSVPASISGTDTEQMDQAKLIAYALNLRNVYQADVIFFFTTRMFDQYSNEICGWAPQANWTGGLFPRCSMILMATESI